MDKLYHHPPEEQFSQNLIVNKPLLRRLVGRTGIGPGDLVYDIGAGTGHITAALLEKGTRVVAVENDERLFRKLQKRFAVEKGVRVCHADFLDMELSSIGTYKIFANIPFFHTASIIKKLLFNKAPPADCYLVVQKEAAEKYLGIPRETLVSLLIKPLFWVDILYHFRPEDFFPVPSVDIVLIQFERRRFPLVPETHFGLYRDFVLSCRRQSERSMKLVMKEYFTFSQLKRTFRLLRIDYHSLPAELDFRQYLGLFQFYLRSCSPNKQNI
jgi:23S rRNA (adenine-N6)-dimethyltransferase